MMLLNCLKVVCLKECLFSVHVEKSFSDEALISCEVPQGLILGPLLFLLYVNDMMQAVNCDLLLYVLFFNIRTLI